ncbi:hypothetical protein MD588_18110 [Photobacterium sp. SDRW27]|nr:hypothetical protein [Photobacterium obscurum]
MLPIQLEGKESTAQDPAAALETWAAPISPRKTTTSRSKPNLQKSRKLAEFDTIIETLRRFDGHRSKTAEELGVSTRALRYKIQTMREQGLDIEQILTGQNTDFSVANTNYS